MKTLTKMRKIKNGGKIMRIQVLAISREGNLKSVNEMMGRYRSDLTVEPYVEYDAEKTYEILMSLMESHGSEKLKKKVAKSKKRITKSRAIAKEFDEILDNEGRMISRSNPNGMFANVEKIETPFGKEFIKVSELPENLGFVPTAIADESQWNEMDYNAEDAEKEWKNKIPRLINKLKEKYSDCYVSVLSCIAF